MAMKIPTCSHTRREMQKAGTRMDLDAASTIQREYHLSQGTLRAWTTVMSSLRTTKILHKVAQASPFLMRIVT